MGACPCLTVVYAVEGNLFLAPASGCLVAVEDRLLWLTAGHVIQALTEVRDKWGIQSARFHDGGSQSVPFDLQGASSFSVYDSVADFGVVEVPKAVADLFRAAASFNPFTVDSFLYLEDLDEDLLSGVKDGDGLYAVGFPREWSSLTVKREGDRLALGISCQAAYAPFGAPLTSQEGIELGLSGISSDFWKPTYLYSRLPDADHVDQATRRLNDVSGISGAPVLLDVAGVPRLLGVQSAWIKSERIAKWVPMTTIKHHESWSARIGLDE